MMRFFAFAFAFVALAATANADTHDHGTHAHTFEAAGLKVVHPWVNATSGESALLYMEIENHGDQPVMLLGAKVEGAGHARIAGFVLKNGAESYQPIPEIPVQSGRALVFEPRALAVQVTGLTRALKEGNHLEAHLETSVGEIEVEFMIEPTDATQHSHAGHQH